MVQPLWIPTPERVKNSNLTRYLNFLKQEKGASFAAYSDLHRWSVTKPADFWESIWKFSGIKSSAPYTKVMGEPKMPGTKWFEGARLNFAENLLRFRDDRIALIARAEGKPRREITYRELSEQVSQVATAIKRAGVEPGDRVAGYLPNIPETVIAMLAATSIGAVWSSCSPDFGVQGVIDRFGQIEPKVLFAVKEYTYNGKRHDLTGRLEEILKKLPSVKQCVVIPLDWEKFSKSPEIKFLPLPFDHPVYILYSSGTTGVPKCIVHGAGGTLLQHAKELILHSDLKPKGRIFFFTTCGWMMWNWLVSSLMTGATVVLYEGSPTFPDTDILWKMAAEEKLTHFGTSPKFLTACEKAGVTPGKSHDLSGLRTVLSTGSPLSVENFQWVYQNVKQDLHLASISGGTDLIGCFMLGNPTLPIYPGEIQSLGLGMKVECWDKSGKPVTGQKGELVCTAPFPSMPVSFWNDPDGKKYRSAYFEHFPNVWRHGDFIEITEHGDIIIYGRSDATLNPGGVRIGTAEIYRQVESLAEVKDSIGVGQRWENDVRVILFVVLKEGLTLDEPLVKKIRETIRKGTTPRHVPAKILQVKEIPYTVSGKKVEMAVANVIHNEPVKNKEALVNPLALEGYKDRRELRET